MGAEPLPRTDGGPAVPASQPQPPRQAGHLGLQTTYLLADRPTAGHAVPSNLLATGQYSVDDPMDAVWPALALSVFSSYHWLVLQTVGLVTEVNLNNMLCPAASDPLGNTYYRVTHMTIFTFLLPLVGKLYSLLARNLISIKGGNKVLTDKKIS